MSFLLYKFISIQNLNKKEKKDTDKKEKNYDENNQLIEEIDSDKENPISQSSVVELFGNKIGNSSLLIIFEKTIYFDFFFGKGKK